MPIRTLVFLRIEVIARVRAVTDSGEGHGQVSDRCGENTRSREHKTDRKNTHVPRRVSVRLRLQAVDQPAATLSTSTGNGATAPR